MNSAGGVVCIVCWCDSVKSRFNFVAGDDEDDVSDVVDRGVDVKFEQVFGDEADD